MVENEQARSTPVLLGDPPGRTTIRGLTREQAGHWKPASAQIVIRYHAYLDEGRPWSQ